MVRIKDTNIEIDIEKAVNTIKEKYDTFAADEDYDHIGKEEWQELSMEETIDEISDIIRSILSREVDYD